MSDHFFVFLRLHPIYQYQSPKYGTLQESSQMFFIQALKVSKELQLMMASTFGML
jgi:hypothetical protein